MSVENTALENGLRIVTDAALHNSFRGNEMVSTTRSMTAEEFMERLFEFPDAGQWSELEEGVVVHLQPPDIDHGTVVLNLSKAFSEYTHSTERGYACFDLGCAVPIALYGLPARSSL